MRLARLENGEVSSNFAHLLLWKFPEPCISGSVSARLAQRNMYSFGATIVRLVGHQGRMPDDVLVNVSMAPDYFSA